MTWRRADLGQGLVGAGEAQLREPRARVDGEGARDLLVDGVALVEGAHDLAAGRRPARAHDRVDGAHDGGQPAGVGARGQQVAEERHGGVVAQVLGRDAQRVEQAAQARLRSQGDGLDVRRDLVEEVEAVIALGVGVDDPRAGQEGVVEQRLGEDRLARAQRADGQHRRGAVAARALAQVEAHRAARGAQRVAEVRASG